MSLQGPISQKINQWLPLILFAAFFVAIASVTLTLSPSWGLMDDFGLLEMAGEFWGPPMNVQAVTGNFITSGMLRPFYYSWAAVFYAVFRDWPAGFYVFIAFCNMAAMIFWGLVFYKIFAVRREDRNWVVFFYPLTFFVFTPFWNIFNYLSLQEKFVVFFAPLVLYFFHRLYQRFSARDCVLMYLCLMCGLTSKATFVFVVFIIFLYPLLDLILFRYRPSISWVFVWVNGLIFGFYALFTLLFQIQGNYTAKYKSGLSGSSFAGKILALPLVMKLLMSIGIIGFLSVIAYCVLKKKPQVSMSVVIYAGLIAYIVLLIPWGFQSYLISAIGPLAMGAVFPVYAWSQTRGQSIKITVNTLIVFILAAVLMGNIVPNIQRMSDIAGAVAFIKTNSPSQDDIYFMPPGYGESAYAAGKFTQKTVHYCSEGWVNRAMLSPKGKNYVILTNQFPAITLKEVSAGQKVYSNGTWEIFEIQPGPKGKDETLRVEFKKSKIHQLKAMIREL